jgi:hypothetical protein
VILLESLFLSIAITFVEVDTKKIEENYVVFRQVHTNIQKLAVLLPNVTALHVITFAQSNNF